jgi:hypothetical protein
MNIFKISKKAQAVLFVYFFITAVIIVVIAAVLAPMGVLFNTKMYEAGEDILARAQADIDNIQDATVQGQINDTIDAALDAGQNNIDVNAAIFQYGWVFVLILTGLIVFMQTRRLIEVGAGGFI